MQCQRCGEREATIHEVTIRNGMAREHHLCEACAAELGMSGSTPPSVAELLPGLLGSGMTGPGMPEPGQAGAGEGSGSGSGSGGASKPGESAPTQPNPRAAARPPACETCGMTFADFRRSGLLGCSSCYAAFESKLGPLIERAHEGGAHHVGKVPRRALQDSRAGEEPERLRALLGDQQERAERLAGLRRQLEQAVAAEQYERAAALRDEISRASDGASDGASGGASDRSSDGGTGGTGGTGGPVRGGVSS